MTHLLQSVPNVYKNFKLLCFHKGPTGVYLIKNPPKASNQAIVVKNRFSKNHVFCQKKRTDFDKIA